jgi:hypothetical protein
MSKRKAFNFFKSYYDVALELSDKDRLAFYDAIIKLQFTGQKTELSGMAKFAFMSQNHSIHSQLYGYYSQSKDPDFIEFKDSKQGASGGADKGASGGASIQVQVQVKEQVQCVDPNTVVFSFDHLSITKVEFDKLVEKYSEDDIFDCFDSIKNYNKNKSYKSLYLTANKWLKKDYKEKTFESELPDDKKIDWKIFLDWFNELYNPKIKLKEVPEQTKKRYLNLLKCGFTKDNLINAITNGKKDRENLTDVTIDTFSYSAMVSKYQKDVTKIGML